MDYHDEILYEDKLNDFIIQSLYINNSSNIQFLIMEKDSEKIFLPIPPQGIPTQYIKKILSEEVTLIYDINKIERQEYNQINSFI